MTQGKVGRSSSGGAAAQRQRRQQQRVGAGARGSNRSRRGGRAGRGRAGAALTAAATVGSIGAAAGEALKRISTAAAGQQPPRVAAAETKAGPAAAPADVPPQRQPPQMQPPQQQRLLAGAGAVASRQASAATPCTRQGREMQGWTPQDMNLGLRIPMPDTH